MTGTINLNAELGLGDTLTIEGPGQDRLTIRASTPTFRVRSNFGNAVLEGLTIADGRAIWVPDPSILNSDSGGGIINWGNLRLVNSTVTNCTAGSTDRIWWDVLASAGGIMNFGGLELDDSTVSDCGASYSGSGILNRGTATLVRSTLSGNYSTPQGLGWGGGLANDTGQVSLTDCIVTGNRGYLGGGIINRGRLTVTGTTFTGNSVNPDTADPSSIAWPEFNGGAIWNYSFGLATLIDSTFDGNQAYLFGGAIGSDGPLSVQGCIFGTNDALNGGSIANAGPATVTDTRFEGSDPNFIYNTSLLDKNATYDYPSYGQISLDGCVFANNDTSGGGGSLVENAASMSIHATTFCDNVTATSGEILNTGILTMTKSVVTHNFATAYGTILNEIQNGGGPAQMTLTDCTVAGNRVYAYGAAFINRGSLTLVNSTVTGNANLIGFSDFGAIENDGGLTLQNSIVAGNTRTDSDVSGSSGVDYWAYTADVPLAGISNSPADPSSSHNLLGPLGTGGLADGVNGNIVVTDAADLKLGLVADNGGTRWTVALLAGSPALDAGDDALAVGPDGNPLVTDQRGIGFARRVGTVDIGAYEAQTPPNRPPTVASDQAATAVDEGSPATNTGTFDDPQGRGTVTLTASLGAIAWETSTGTWSWSYTPPDGPSGPTTVTITATDDGGLTAATSFTLTVNDVAPTAAITGAPASGHIPEVTSIILGSLVTDPSPADTAAGFTYAWSVTKNGVAFGSGTAASFTFTPDDNGTYVVSLTATDKDNATGPAARTTIFADDVAPTATITGPSDGVRGQARTFILTASDPSSVDQAAGFTFAIAWGDGSTQSVTGPSGTAISHVYTASGAYGVQVTASDNDGLAGASDAKTDTITAVALETDPVDPTKTALFVGGTSAADVITLKPADGSGTIAVKIGQSSLGKFRPTGRIVVYGQAGDDIIAIQSETIPHSGKVLVSTPADLFGDAGNDILDTAGSTANNVLVGGAGNDILQAGPGRDLLIGGLGTDLLLGAGGDDILVGGTTDFDANLIALDSVMAEWGRTDADNSTRINHLKGTLGGGRNGTTFLTTATVNNDAAIDMLFGEGGTDWFFIGANRPNHDRILGGNGGDVITGV